MKKYIRIQKTVKATQYDGTSASAVAVLTLMGASLKGDFTITPDLLEFYHDGDERRIRNGDWLVEEGIGNFGIIPDETFKADFIAAENLPKGTPIPTEENNSAANTSGPETEAKCDDPRCLPCRLRRLLATLNTAPNEKKMRVTALGPFSSIEEAEKAMKDYMESSAE